MQEVKSTGEIVLTDGATPKDIERALQDVEVAQVHIYKPGEIVILVSGTRYRIGEHGNWIRIK